MRDRRVTAACVVLGVIATHAGWLAFVGSGKRAASDLIQLAATLATSGCCAVAARRAEARMRRAWAFMAAGSGSWAFGAAAWAWFELVRGREVPFPSLADVGYLAAIPLVVAGLLSFTVAPSRLSSRLRTALDGVIIGSSLLFVSWAAVLGPLYRGGEGSLAQRAIGLAYPAGDVVIASIVVLVAARSGRSSRGSFAMLGVAVLALALSDSGFAYLNLVGAYETGNLIDVGWTAAWCLVALASLQPAPHAAVQREERAVSPGVFLPYAAVLLAILVAAAQQIRHGALEPFLFWNAVATILLVVGRQFLTILENVSLNRNLEALVRERTGELEVAIEEIGHARHLQDEFVANVSHELRTPLTTMLGAVGTLMRPEFELDERAAVLVRAAQRGGARMHSLIEDLLQASGLTQGPPPVREPVVLSTLLRDAAAQFLPLGKTVVTAITPGLVALGEPERIRVIVSHLLANADKFGPDGSVIALEASRVDDEVNIVVRDAGAGIPERLRGKVFERFFQVDGSTTRRRRGVGLGLYLARQLAEAMGGSLRLDPGSVSAFRLKLPAIVSSHPVASIESIPLRTG